jgi:hypothetical protein
MRECENVLERLPELLHERLSAVERERVLAHVRGCAACAAELAWLRTMREGIVAAAPRVDVAAIARGVHAKLGAAPTLRLVTTDEGTAPPVVRGTRPVSRPRWASAGLRAAAALAVVAAGAASVLVARRGPDAPPTVAVETPATPSATPESVPATQVGSSAPGTQGVQSRPMQVAAAEPEAPLGVSLADLSDDELAAVIAAIGDEGGTLPADPAPASPVVTSGGMP